MGLDRLSRFTPWATCLLLALPSAASGAEITRVATAFEANNPFDLNLDVGFERTWRQGRITRENRQETPGVTGTSVVEVAELRYSEISNQLPMRAAFGIFRDLELHVSTSLVFFKNRSWGYDSGVTNTTSTIYNNCVDMRAPLGAPPFCVPTQGGTPGAQPIFGVPGSSNRAGLGDFVLGFSWAALNDQKDDTKPKWVLSFDYEIPSAAAANPSQATSSASPGGIGEKAHRFNFSTALSKRLGAIDPYVKVTYSLPTQAPGFWTNCNTPDKLAYPENCGDGPWTAQETGIKPQHRASVVFGAEFYAYDDPSKHQRVGFDLQLGGTWVSEGRIANELSDALGKLLYTEEYLTLGGKVGVYARAADFVQLRLNASLYHDTEHFLTNEPVGKDRDNACSSGGSPCIDLDNRAKEINPNYDFRYDTPGRRFRINQVTVFSVMATGTINF